MTLDEFGDVPRQFCPPGMEQTRADVIAREFLKAAPALESVTAMTPNAAAAYVEDVRFNAQRSPIGLLRRVNRCISNGMSR